MFKYYTLLFVYHVGRQNNNQQSTHSVICQTTDTKAYTWNWQTMMAL